MTSGSPEAGSDPRLCWICGPITGYCDTAELTRLVCSARVVPEHDVQHRDQDEQQREERGEGVVGDQRGEVPGLVVLELRPDRDGNGKRRATAAGTGRPHAEAARCRSYASDLPGPRGRHRWPSGTRLTG